jgi:uncharacterized membrane protein YfcA
MAALALLLAIAVFVGGQIGSRLGMQALSNRVLRRLTAVLVLYVGGRLLFMGFA